MEYTVQALAKLAGVSPRTLRWYDHIGLLAPGRRGENGYRLYGPEEVDRLQQVLFYRALGVELGEIKALLDDPAFDETAALQSHLLALQGEQKRLAALIRTVEATLAAKERRTPMKDEQKFEGLKAQLVAENEKTHGKEARTRYGDAPLEAYARLARARSRMEVSAASGYARRRLAQFKTALRTDSDNAAKIKAAINQLQKAVNRGERKKRELDREHLTEVRRKRAAKEDLKEKERRLRQELLRRKSQRIIRESGYMREAEISDRLASQLTATQMELRQQAQDLAAATSASLEAAVQQYAAAAEPVPSAPAEAGFSGQA